MCLLQTIVWTYLLHRYINVQTENLLGILIVHLNQDVVNSSWGLHIEDSLLDNTDLSRLLRAGKTVDVDVSALQRKIDSGILAKTSLLIDHLHSHVRGSKNPIGTISDLLINLSISVNSGVLLGHNRVVDNLNGVEVSVSL